LLAACFSTLKPVDQESDSQRIIFSENVQSNNSSYDRSNEIISLQDLYDSSAEYIEVLSIIHKMEDARHLQSINPGNVFGIELMDANRDGYTDIVFNTGGTWNETHDIYIWDDHTCNFNKAIFEGFEMLAWFEVYDGYIKNFIRGSSPDDSVMEFLIWGGDILKKADTVFDESDYSNR
jgi:hypothetical protein